MDDFSSGNLSGGTGWNGPWSGGSVSNSAQLNSLALHHTGNSPQQVKRNFVGAIDNTQDFSISFDFAIRVDQSQGGNYGFRTYIESEQNAVFSVVWKNDVENGNLTFYHTNGQKFVINAAGWDLGSDIEEIQKHTYNFSFDISPGPGQNPGQYSGKYIGTVTRDDNQSFSTGSVDWRSTNIPSNQFDEIVFFNSSSKTTTQFDNFKIGDLSSVPEPTSTLLVALSSLALLRRRR